MVKNLRLETKNLIVRPYTKEDAKNLYDTLNDENILKYIPEEPISMEQAQNAIDWLISNYDIDLDSDYKYSFAIEAKETNDYVGWCGFGYLDYDKSQKEIYFTLKSKYWGQGLATEASKTLIDYIFNELELKKLVAVVKPENRASQKVIEKLGFEYEGVVENLPEEFSFYEGERYYTLKG
ncbi:GNAT family N-acetyltransferase [Irregularibacter muris]|uniref:GNAT family N-acetyltransferase n=1 Tax=Irregularibacter muris TaxID=1796619 RepID=A0AAE3HII0_9FIRM|nr:GNAT family N-acetyltransferase [Irregularibacter muris]MCR1900142.1 GNAT family N-acetyltransferase [Irregularibacter muris]